MTRANDLSCLVRPRGLRVALVAAAAAILVIHAGCYRRVIRAEGPGADRYNVEEPYQEDYLIDDVLFGDKPKPREARPKPR